MFYEPDPPRRRSARRRRRRPGCLLRLIRLLLFLALAVAVIGYVQGSDLDLLLRREALSRLRANPDLPYSRTNILLAGVDQTNAAGSRSDAMMIASIGPGGDVRLVSLMRDTMVDIPGHGRHKLNAAWSLGGPALAMETINAAFSINILRYASIDFTGFAALIDALGGVEIDITQAERDAMNASARPRYQLASYGPGTHLTGAQALRYARLRKLDSDYMRASRQRKLLGAVLNKLRASPNPLTLVSFIRCSANAIDTNLSPCEIALLSAKVLPNGDLHQYRIPVDGAFESGVFEGVWQIRPDLSANSLALREALYGTTD